MREIDAAVGATPAPGRPVLVGIDGVDGSGKTTFATWLAARYAECGRTAHVVHLDDFLNPREVRYRLGRDSAEGYLRDTYDLTAVRTLVLDPLRCSEPPWHVVPRAFDHRTDQRVAAERVDVAADDVVVVEGMFVHRDELLGVWDLSFYLDVPFEISVARMARRDGTSADPEDPSLHRYVEGQRRYLAACSPADRATWVVAEGRESRP